MYNILQNILIRNFHTFFEVVIGTITRWKIINIFIVC